MFFENKIILSSQTVVKSNFGEELEFLMIWKKKLQSI